jgi:hypothetical protein
MRRGVLVTALLLPLPTHLVQYGSRTIDLAVTTSSRVPEPAQALDSTKSVFCSILLSQAFWLLACFSDFWVSAFVPCPHWRSRILSTSSLSSALHMSLCLACAEAFSILLQTCPFCPAAAGLPPPGWSLGLTREAESQGRRMWLGDCPSNES